MKKIKTTLLLLPVLFLAAACGEDTEMNTYPARSDEAFFAATQYSYAVSGDMEDAYTVTVYRANPAGNESVPVSIAVEDETLASVFSAAATVEFTARNISSMFKVSFDRSKLEIGKEVLVDINVAPTELPYATTCTLSVMRDYTWVKYATGTYDSGLLPNFFGQAVSWEQDLEEAQEKPGLFRLPDWYHNAGTSYTSAGYHLQFTWDGGAAVVFSAPADEYGCVMIDSGFEHPSYGMVSLYIDSAPEYTGYDADTKTFTFNYAGLVSAGQLTDWIDDTFTLSAVSGDGE